ncbi:MAG TPA: hypothetical protein IAA65_05920 [Candidatus Galloscillospira excrementipullorum]|nr:hypothetical protein [Candidatus Galloscillospira excrementipullorum]
MWVYPSLNTVHRQAQAPQASRKNAKARQNGRCALFGAPLNFAKFLFCEIMCTPTIPLVPVGCQGVLKKSALFFYPAKGPACKAASFFPGNSCPKEALSHNFEPMLKYLPYPPPSAARPTLFPNRFELKKAAYQISFQRLPQRGFASQSAPQRGAFPRPSPLFLNLSCFPAHFPNVLSPAAPKKQLKGRACA